MGSPIGYFKHRGQTHPVTARTGVTKVVSYQNEIARLNAQLRLLRAETKLERTRAKVRLASGRASVNLAKAKHARRKARLIELEDRFIAKGYPVSQAIRKARQELKRL